MNSRTFGPNVRGNFELLIIFRQVLIFSSFRQDTSSDGPMYKINCRSLKVVFLINQSSILARSYLASFARMNSVVKTGRLVTAHAAKDLVVAIELWNKTKGNTWSAAFIKRKKHLEHFRTVIFFIFAAKRLANVWLANVYTSCADAETVHLDRSSAELILPVVTQDNSQQESAAPGTP